MSTADGAILAMGTVMSHNVIRQLDSFFPDLVTADNLLLMARVTTLPMTIASTMIGAFYRSSHSAGATGYLLIVAFDIVFGTVVVPLFGCFYAKVPSPRAALLAIIAGAVTRIVLEFALPKDGFLLLPYKNDIFLNVGPAPSSLFPEFIDVDPSLHWVEGNDGYAPCEQQSYEDFTGVDSLAGFLACLLVFLFVQTLENILGRPLFEFGSSAGYLKDTSEHPLKKTKDVEDEEEVAEGE